MRKLSQKELLHEGFSQFTAGLFNVAKTAAKGLAKSAMPATTSALGGGWEATKKAFKQGYDSKTPIEDRIRKMVTDRGGYADSITDNKKDTWSVSVYDLDYGPQGQPIPDKSRKPYRLLFKLEKDGSLKVISSGRGYDSSSTPQQSNPAPSTTTTP
jgi:hypothetical protein